MAGAAVYSQKPSQQNQGQTPPPPPKRPRKNPYRDGLSKASQHYDLFEMIRHPHLAKDARPPNPPPGPLYPWEKPPTKQQLINKKIEAKFKKNQNRLPRKSLRFVTGFIKFLFLVFVFPPYMILYGFPRWVFTRFLPAIGNKISNSVRAVIQGIKNFFARIYHKVTDPFSKLWKQIRAKEKNLPQETDDEDLSFFSFIAHGVIFIYLSLVRPTGRAFKWSYQTGKKILFSIYNFPSMLKGFLQNKLTKIADQLKRMGGIPKRLLQTLRQSWQRRIATPLKEWLKQKISFCKRKAQSALSLLKSRLYSIYETIKNKALFPFRWAKRGFQKVTAACTRSSKKAFLVLKQWTTAKLERLKQIKEALKRGLKNIFTLPSFSFFRSIQRRLVQVKNALLNYKNRLSAAIKFIFSKETYTELKKKFAKSLLLRLLKSIESLRRGCGALKRHITAPFIKLLDRINQRVKKILSPIKELFKLACKPFIVLYQKLAATIKQKWQSVKRFFLPVGKAIRYLVLQVRIMTAWFKVLMSYGMQTVRSHAQRIWDYRLAPELD